MATANRNDPLPVFCFKVQWDLGGEAFFKSVSGLRYETERATRVATVPIGPRRHRDAPCVPARRWSAPV